MSKRRSTNPFSGFVRVKEPDKDALADLVKMAMGEERSLTSFALDCGVSPSTLSRIINKRTSKANSDDLIAAIAENADPQSGVTLSALLEAHGLQRIPEQESAEIHSIHAANPQNGNRKERAVQTDGSALERSARNIIQNELLSRGYTVSLEMRRNLVDIKNLRYLADFSIRTDALQSIGIENWSFDVHYSAVRPILHKLSWLLGAAYLSRFRERGEKVSIITIDSDEYNDVMNRFGNVTIKDCISVILIDNYRRKILKEFQIPMEGQTEPMYVFEDNQSD